MVEDNLDVVQWRLLFEHRQTKPKSSPSTRLLQNCADHAYGGYVEKAISTLHVENMPRALTALIDPCHAPDEQSHGDAF